MQCHWFLKFPLPSPGVQGVFWPGIFGVIYPGQWRCLHYPSWYIAAAPDWPQSKILGVGDRDSPNLSVRQEFVARLESLQESIIIDYILFLYSSGRLMFPHSFSSVMFLGQCLL